MYTNTIESNSRVFLDWSDPDNVQRKGWETPNGTKLVEATPSTVVIKVPGHSYNPGSRNSMLRNYARAQYEVYLVPERKTETTGWAYPITGFDVRNVK